MLIFKNAMKCPLKILAVERVRVQIANCLLRRFSRISDYYKATAKRHIQHQNDKVTKLTLKSRTPTDRKARGRSYSWRAGCLSLKQSPTSWLHLKP